MTGSGHSPIASGPLDSFRGRQKVPVLYLNITKKNIHFVVLKNKTVRNRGSPRSRF